MSHSEGWRTDVGIAESLRFRIERHKDDPKMKAILEVALHQHLASNMHLATKSELEHISKIIPRAITAAVETDR